MILVFHLHVLPIYAIRGNEVVRAKIDSSAIFWTRRRFRGRSIRSWFSMCGYEAVHPSSKDRKRLVVATAIGVFCLSWGAYGYGMVVSPLRQDRRTRER